MRFIPLILALFSSVASSDTYLCQPEAGAVVSHGGKGGISSTAWSESNIRYILTNKSGEWVVKQLGLDNPIFDYCLSKYFCEMKTGWGGAFLFDPDGFFTVIQPLTSDRVEQNLVVEKGRCTKL